MLGAVAVLAAGCDSERRPDDTLGEQTAAQWEWRGRLIVDTDPRWTLVRLRIDTAGATADHDVLLARFQFDPTAGPGDEYALALGVELGDARALPLHQPLALGGSGAAGLAAVATITRLGTPLRPDSVRGTLTLSRRGLRQLTGRVDARLYFTAWDDTAVHATYELRQQIFGVK